MEFTKKAQNIKKELSRLGHRLRENGRRLFAVLLCASMVLSGFPGSFFQAFASDDNEEYYYELERESLYEAVCTAVSEGTTVDRELDFTGEYAEQYAELFEPDGTLYELKDLEFERDRERDKILGLRVFVRLDGDIPLDGYYDMTADDSFIFLITSRSKDTVDVEIYIDDLETGTIEVVPASSVKGDLSRAGITAADGTAEMSSGQVTSGSGDEYPDIDDPEDSPESADDSSDDPDADDSDEKADASDSDTDDTGTDQDASDTGIDDSDDRDDSDTDGGSSDGGVSGTDESGDSDTGSGSSDTDGSDPDNKDAHTSSRDDNAGSSKADDDQSDTGNKSSHTGSHDGRDSSGKDSDKSDKKSSSSEGRDHSSDGSSGTGTSKDKASSDHDDSGKVASVSLKKAALLGAGLSEITVDPDDEESDISDDGVVTILPDDDPDDALLSSSDDTAEIQEGHKTTASPSDADYETASASDADRVLINGDIYEAVRLDAKKSAVAFVTDAGELGLEQFSALEEQTVNAEIYTDESYEQHLSDGTDITLSGKMPVDAQVKAYPVDLELEDLNVLAAYDITIFDRYGNTFQPDEDIEVTIENPDIQDALADAGELTVYHMDDEFDDPEEVAVVSADSDIVSFLADRFSIYLLADGVMPLAGETGFAVYCETDGSLTFYADTSTPSVGSTYPADNGKTVTKVYTGVESTSTSSNPPWYSDRTTFTTVVFDNSFNVIKPTSCHYWFYGFSNCTEITGLEYLDTSSVTDMSNMFQNCSSLTSLDVSGFDTSSVTNMLSVFNGCSSLTSLDVSNWNTSRVTSMRSMFNGCSSLTTIYSDDDNFVITQQVKDEFDSYSSYSMFNNCTSLVGGEGTEYSENYIRYEWARVDDLEANNKPGYFTSSAGRRYKLDIYKYSEDGNGAKEPLAGAEFNLKNESEETAWFERSEDNIYTFVGWDSDLTDTEGYTSTLVSGENGFVYIENLLQGDYQLMETKAPDGYSKINEPVDFTINLNGSISEDTPQPSSVSVHNVPSLSAPVAKGNDETVDNKTSLLEAVKNGLSDLFGNVFMTAYAAVYYEDDINPKKVVDKDEAIPGETLSYTITYTNTTGAALTVTITDTLDEFLNAPTNISDGGTYDGTSRTISWTIEVPAGETITVSFDAKIESDAVGTVENIAYVNDNETNKVVTEIDRSPAGEGDGYEIIIQKVWEDDENAAGKRPTEISYTLKYNDYSGPIVVHQGTLNESNNWRNAYTENTYDPSTLTIEEDGVEYPYVMTGAEMTQTGQYQFTFTLTNTYFGTETPVIEVANKLAGSTCSFDIQKTSESNDPLSGAEFVLQNSDNQYASFITDSNGSYKFSEWVDNESEETKLTSGTDGCIHVTEIKAGTYTLTETKAPDGYTGLAESVTFTLSSDGVILITTNEDVSVNDDKTEMTVVNTTGSELPETGGPGTFTFYMTGMLLTGSAFLLAILRRRRRWVV